MALCTLAPLSNSRQVADTPTLGERTQRVLLQLGGANVDHEGCDAQLLFRVLTYGRPYRGRVDVVDDPVQIWRDNRTRLRVYRGFALDDDGVWRPHVWSACDGRVFDRTPARAYFGLAIGAQLVEREIRQHRAAFAIA